MTFGDELEHFVCSINIVENQVKNDLIGLIREYLKSVLEIKFVVFHTESGVNGEMGLKTSNWLSTETLSPLSLSIKKSDGSYAAQVTMAYDKCNPMWIHGEKCGELVMESKYQDKWSDSETDLIPKYIRNTNIKARTSIIIPARDIVLSRVIGVVNFESDLYIEFSEARALELEKIVNSIAILYMLNRTFAIQSENTKKGVSYFSKRSQKEINFKRLSKPTIFIASASNAKQDVMAIVIDVLELFKEKGLVDYTYWKDMVEPGIVVTQLDEEISRCLFGICYFSQPDEAKSFIDNPNQ